MSTTPSSSQEQVALLTDYAANSKYSTAYHTLYANIRLNLDSSRIKQQAILLASPTPYAGQSITAANIAITAAQNGTPTIIVDANVRTPSLQQRFGVGDQPGLTDLLAENTITTQIAAARLCDTFVPDLRLLCAGKTTLAESNLLPQDKLQTIVNSLRELLAASRRETGLIVFTCAPILANADAAQISALVDQTFLTLVSGHTTRNQAKQAQEQLQRTHANLVGIVMLNV